MLKKKIVVRGMFSIYGAKSLACYLRKVPESDGLIKYNVSIISLKNDQQLVVPEGITEILKRPDASTHQKRWYNLYNTAQEKPLSFVEQVEFISNKAIATPESREWLTDTNYSAQQINVLVSNLRALQKKNEEAFAKLQSMTEIQRSDYYDSLLTVNAAVSHEFNNNICRIAASISDKLDRVSIAPIRDLYFRAEVNELVALVAFDSAMVSVLGYEVYVQYYKAIAHDMHFRILLKHLLYNLGNIRVDYITPTLYGLGSTVTTLSLAFFHDSIRKILIKCVAPLILPRVLSSGTKTVLELYQEFLKKLLTTRQIK